EMNAALDNAGAHSRINVLQVKTFNSIAEATEVCRRLDSGIEGVTGVQADAEQIAGDGIEEPLRLVFELDVGRDVRVEDSAQPVLRCNLRDGSDRPYECLEPVGVEPGRALRVASGRGTRGRDVVDDE